ncbi:MAG: RdgB/HAM1 family non-canonical purine NTP pyrophosphatase [Oscillospiraceae bacterium]|jgi:XTP/dITP diphosphohydrolase|nr:RdgB/HAM1 family non-canonical purine NTP pyrophosphatase [Oscillospiraceae bacterium]
MMLSGNAVILLATNNADKVREMSEILSPLGFDIKTPRELGVVLEVEETGESFEDNARLKARAFCEKTGLPALADDSGLCVAALDGAPGVHSARYGGVDSNEMRRSFLLTRMQTQENRAAKFVTCILCALPNGDEIVEFGEEVGEITRAPRGDSGFGYDPVFFYPPLGKTNAEMTPSEKNSVSARGAALRHFAQALGAYYEKW